MESALNKSEMSSNSQQPDSQYDLEASSLFRTVATVPDLVMNYFSPSKGKHDSDSPIQRSSHSSNKLFGTLGPHKNLHDDYLRSNNFNIQPDKDAELSHSLYESCLDEKQVKSKSSKGLQSSREIRQECTQFQQIDLTDLDQGDDPIQIINDSTDDPNESQQQILLYGEQNELYAYSEYCSAEDNLDIEALTNKLNQTHKQKIKGLDFSQIEYCEKLIFTAKAQCQLPMLNQFQPILGDLLITNYKIVFVKRPGTYKNSNGQEVQEPLDMRLQQYTTITYGMLSRISQQVIIGQQPYETINSLDIHSKDQRKMTIIVDEFEQLELMSKIIEEYAFKKEIHPEHLIMNYQIPRIKSYLNNQTNESVYADPLEEFSRQGIDIQNLKTLSVV